MVTTAMGQSSDSGSFLDRMKNLFSAAPPQPGPQKPQEEDAPPCPVVDIRSGASTLTVYGAGEQVATNVRYQGTIAQTARECAALGATMAVKVGMQGRIILGPLGGPGQLDVPIRLAVVHEGPEPKTIWTKLYRVPVTIPAGQGNVPFVHVEQDITFPLPKAADLEMYVLYVGFDQLGLKEQKPKGKPQKPKGKQQAEQRSR